MSNTPYKDELIRIAALLGLPDETDPLTIAGHVEALACERDTLRGRLSTAEVDLSRYAQLRSYLLTLASQMRQRGQFSVAEALSKELRK